LSADLALPAFFSSVHSFHPRRPPDLDDIPAVPADATPGQRIYRKSVTQLSDGAVLEGAADFRQIAKNMPRHNH
jgi:hypothetical protein